MDSDVTHGAGDVLVVDDDPLAVELLVDLLNEEEEQRRSTWIASATSRILTVRPSLAANSSRN